MFVIFSTLCYVGTFLHLCLNAIKVLYVIMYVVFWSYVVYVWYDRLYVKGVRPRPLTCGKGGELKRIKYKLRVFDPGRLLVVRVGNLNELRTS